jgi:hypothetical protein
MEYIITPEKLDKVMKPYFDKVFEDTKWSESNLDGETWQGLINQDGELLVGHPEHDNTAYYTNGQYFSNMWDLFSIDYNEFYNAMGRYIKKEYGCEFDYIW